MLRYIIKRKLEEKDNNWIIVNNTILNISKDIIKQKIDDSYILLDKHDISKVNAKKSEPKPKPKPKPKPEFNENIGILRNSFYKLGNYLLGTNR